MAKFCGKDFLVQLETAPSVYTTIAGMRSTGMTINKETVDVTDKGDTPWRQLLDGCGIKSMELSGSGIFTDAAVMKTIMTEMLTGDASINAKLISGAGDTFVGKFHIPSFERNGEYNGAEQFSISLASAGAVTYTAIP